MSEREKGQEQSGSRAKVYTGEGFEGAEHPVPRTPRRAASDTNRRKRRSEILREEEERSRSEAQNGEKAEPKRRGETQRENTDSKRRGETQQENTEPKRSNETQRENTNSKRRGETQQENADSKVHSGKPEIESSEGPGKQEPAPEVSRIPRFWRQMSLRKRALCGVGAAVAVLYVAVAVYFGSHFYGGTTVYGIDCSRKTADEVKAEIKDKLGDYTLNIQARENKSAAITASQIDLQYEDDGSIDRLLKSQRSYVWPVMILLGRSKSSPVAFSYDIPLATESISKLAFMDASHMVAPHDAYISPTDTGYEVAREVMGTTLNEARTRETILTALNDGRTQLSLEEGGCYVNPAVYQNDDELQQDAAAMSKLGRASITLDLGNSQELINAAVIQDWITKTTAGEYVIDDAKVTEYVERLAARYDTFGLPVDFYTSIGTTVTLSGGDYGWCIDQSATVIALLKALNEGYRGTMEPVYVYQGMSHENNGIGYTYVEICISRQEMWCYRDGELVVDTPVVTGNPNKGNGTPAGGVWAIDAKQRNATLVGEDYRSPVDYWMPFNGNIGIHDLQTRAYFGDTIYLYAGSHGCVNTPYDAVRTIYDTVSVGTPVIVYE